MTRDLESPAMPRRAEPSLQQRYLHQAFASRIDPPRSLENARRARQIALRRSDHLVALEAAEWLASLSLEMGRFRVVRYYARALRDHGKPLAAAIFFGLCALEDRRAVAESIAQLRAELGAVPFDREEALRAGRIVRRLEATAREADEQRAAPPAPPERMTVGRIEGITLHLGSVAGASAIAAATGAVLRSPPARGAHAGPGVTLWLRHTPTDREGSLLATLLRLDAMSGTAQRAWKACARKSICVTMRAVSSEERADLFLSARLVQLLASLALELRFVVGPDKEE